MSRAPNEQAALVGMFGSFRLVLALMVVLAHLWPAATLWSGVYAVFGFYVLSGYLMANVLDRSYSFDVAGTGRYLANRALRIYPPYLLVVAIALVLVLADPHLAATFNVRQPRDWIEWLRNLTIFSLHISPTRSARLVPPSWSVDIELCFYLAMGLGLARGRRIVEAWFVASLCVTVYLVMADYEFPARYASLYGASLPYAMGAMVHHHRIALSRWLAKRWHVLIALSVWAVNAALPRPIWHDTFGKGFYANLVLTSYVIATLSLLDRGSVSKRFARVDAWLGNLSYPVFLSHLPIAGFIALLGGPGAKGRDLFLLGVPIIIVVSWILHQLSEKPVERFRDRVRGRSLGDA